MGKIKFILGFLALFVVAVAIYVVLQSEHALLTHPKGVIARRELHLLSLQILLMLVVILPTFIILFTVAWKYRAKSRRSSSKPEQVSGGVLTQIIFWAVPSIVISCMGVILWNETHALDPFKRLESEVEPLRIQVIALDWKWLFIYPDQEIAALNFVQFPEKTPIHLELSADGSPMNSFWLPELSGQIYAMSGMVTSLHMMADAPGVYRGRAAEINGDGYAGMTFIAESTSQADFEKWVALVKQSPVQLTDAVYNELLAPSQNDSVKLYSAVPKGMLHKITMKYMPPEK